MGRRLHFVLVRLLPQQLRLLLLLLWGWRRRYLGTGADRYAWFLNLLESDVGFLRDHGLIDYSLLVGIHFKQKGSTADYVANHIMSRDGANEVYYIGIIDFLIKYHMKKKMEGNIRGAVVNMKNKNKDMKYSALSVTHPNEYSARMIGLS